MGARSCLCAVLAIGAGAAHAMVFYATADPDFNTTAPAGTLAGSGWQWVGIWGGFQAAPIGPHHFLASRHIGGAVGDPFLLNGATYTTVAFTDDPTSDLRIWEVRETFPSWAPLYRASDEVGRDLVVFGRGLLRGAEVQVDGVLKGWQWSTSDGRLRWGQNTVASVKDGGSGWGEMLRATFDQTGGPNEADLTSGDSSAPVFINDGTGWKLAGVGAAVDAYFNTTNAGSGFIAALFDSRGLYYSATPPTGWVLIQGAAPLPVGFYATRVSVHAAWIDRVAPPPETGADAPVLSPGQLGSLGALLSGAGVAAIRRRSRRAPQ